MFFYIIGVMGVAVTLGIGVRWMIMNVTIRDQKKKRK